MFSNYTDVYCTYKRFLYFTNLKTDTNLTFQDSILKFQEPISYKNPKQSIKIFWLKQAS